jgi:hypothetical protein
MTSPSRRWLLSLLVAAAACGNPAAKQAGDTCVASSECAAGLVCDFGQTPAVCAGSVTVDAREIDAPADAPTDAAEIDAREIDARVIDAAVIDAPIDAPVDAPIDAEIDAPIDAPPDA